MRIIAVALAALGGGAAGGSLACANVGDPPGGPPITTPPVVVEVRPESGAVVPDWKGAAIIRFDDVIDEMASAPSSGGGPAGLGRYVLLSPVAGPVKVGWHRSSISIEPKEGWKPGRVYHLQLLPGIVDLRHNTRKQGLTIVFSTGPAIPTAGLNGAAVLWVEQRALTPGLIRAVPVGDTVGYFALTDSAGRFRLDAIPPGHYVVFAINDLNNNRQRDRREPYDSSLVTLDTSASVTFWAFVHDTVGPRGRGADPIDSLAFRVNLTQPLDPTAPLDTARVRVVALPDSTPVAITAILTQSRYDSLVARERAVADSLRRAADTTAKGDTTRRDTTAQARRDTAQVSRAGAGRRAPAGGRDTAAHVDTSGLRRLLSQRPAPTDRIVIRVDKPLLGGRHYLARVRGLRSLSGVNGDAQAVLSVPKAAPPPPSPAHPFPPRPKAAARDTTRVRRDSTKP
jgi:hypothetical protein